MAEKKRIPLEPSSFGHNPFAGLNAAGLPAGPAETTPNAPAAAPVRKKRGRVDIIREKAGRGGKTVTVVTHFIGVGRPEMENFARQLQKICGTGGTVKEGRIEIQGDKRPEVKKFLEENGFQPVLAGG